MNGFNVSPHALDILVLRQILGDVVTTAGEDIDDSSRHVRSLQHLQEEQGRSGSVPKVILSCLAHHQRSREALAFSAFLPRQLFLGGDDLTPVL